MTNQEAITKLTNIMHDDHYAWHPSILTAFSMAVDALKGADGDCISRQFMYSLGATCLARPNDKGELVAITGIRYLPSVSFPQGHENDCINRQDAMDIANDIRDRISVGGYWEWIERLKRLPSAQPEQRWIPCGKCIHADGKHRWCKVLDRTINEDYFCYWAEPFREEGEADGLLHDVP